MFQIRHAIWLAPAVRRITIEAPRIAARRKPGHFVIVRLRDGGERIPLTIADTDISLGTITLIVQAVGASTRDLCAREAGEFIKDVVGPLGQPTELARYGHAVLVGGGVGTAVIYPQAAALKKLGNRITAIIGGRSKDYVILEHELAAVCDAVHACTDDGSYGYHGLVTGMLQQLMQRDERIDCVLTAGPVPMMRAVAEVTRPAGIKTIASLNPIMVDGTGMCGGCRVMVDGVQRFACVDGPEFDAHQVDFASLASRLSTYRRHEQAALAQPPAEKHQCELQKLEEQRRAEEVLK